MTILRQLGSVARSRRSIGWAIAVGLAVHAAAQPAPAPIFEVSYTLPTNQNSVPLTSGGTLQFPPILVSNSITASVSISNTGTGPGPVGSINTSGNAFAALGLPLLPATIQPGSTLTFFVRYSPTIAGTDTGTLTIGLGGSVFTATLSGSSIISTFSYAVSTPSGDVAFTPGQAVPIPDTALGQTTSLLIKVQNIGTIPASIGVIAASPAVYTVTSPPVLPATLNPNSLITFTLNFTPAVAGKTQGSLQVGNDLFALDAIGLGPKYTFSYGTPNPVTVLAGGTVVFSPLQVGQKSQLPFTLTNSGTAAGTIASIAVADTSGVYKLLNLPALPLNLNPGDTATFTIQFAPVSVGFATSTLQIDTQSFTLSGSGSAPPPLPDFQFTGASGAVAPLHQLAVGLTLSAPYSLPLTGVLTITVNSNIFASDPSVQFSTGGRTVSFTIPANTTQAVFPTGGSQILLQSGSTAGTITITPSFATKAGLDLTPDSPPTVVFAVAAAAPQLLSVQVTNVTQASFAVSVTGLSTTHTISRLTFQFTPSGGGKPTPYVVDVAAASGLWYSSTAAQPFGGQFAASVPFAIPSPSTTALATHGIQSVSVTATNAQGTSNAVSLSLQ